ncbi:MAG TPA: DUF4397 domain-containing protein [Pseudosphingobacterium sp.]|nr:DUF4397 domain-containing protein [Pseudosphingobacterium sp.]
MSKILNRNKSQGRKKVSICWLLMVCCLMLNACKKEKMDVEKDNRTVTDNRVASFVRLVNLTGFNQVIANGDSLTNFVVRDPQGPDYYKYPGTDYFPEDGRIGKIWTIPQDLFDQKETLELKLFTRSFQGLYDEDLTLNVTNNYSQPTDYYLLPTRYMEGQPAMVAVPRGVTAPAKPDHFKIRIVNLSGNIKNPASNSNGVQEDLQGALSLAFADGTLVDQATSNISVAQQTSEYIEMPYGTYQFKVLTANGRQVPGANGELSDFKIIDPATSTIPTGLMETSGLVYAPIKTYQPGGVYTMVITPQSFDYFINENDETAGTLQNAFQIIEDNSVPANNTYARIQAVNAWKNEDVGLHIDGTTIAQQIAFGDKSAYINQIKGKHKIEAVNAGGEVIASTELIVQPGQNYTAWLYAGLKGEAQLLIVANDLSGSWYVERTSPDDATFNRFQFQFYFHRRFLNLSPDNPYITFTQNDGQQPGNTAGNSDANENLQPGMPKLEQPYIRSSYNQLNFEIMAYRSTPTSVPGVWAQDIVPLQASAFVANRILYEQANRSVPVQEAGIYTIALIGPSGGNDGATKAKMILIKHNK